MIKSISKYQAATAIAVFFHTIGLFGILFFDREFFIRTTPYNLVLSFLLLLWTQFDRNSWFWIFVGSCFVVGVAVEVIGVNTSLLFGHYRYGEALGLRFKEVPLLIGINWFIVIYCCGVSINTLLMKLMSRLPAGSEPKAQTLKALSVVVDGATLAVVFDWLMEPVAVKLNYWQWLGDGSIPFFNYVCWFVVSILLLLVFHYGKFEKRNNFAVNLLLIQVMFFLLLRTFLD